MKHRPVLNHALPTQLAVSLLVVICILQLPALGQEFRIESQVYAANSQQPVSHNITLFSEGLVYDFQLSEGSSPDPVEIVIFDSRNRTLILLDLQREMRMDLQELQLLKIVDGVRRETIQDKRSSFFVDDTFQEDVDHSTNWATLTSPLIEYRVRGARPKDASVLPLYADFLNNFTMLNATDPTKLPPFARIRLNQTINQLGWIANEVQISIKQNSLLRQPFRAKSTHVVIHQLSDTDRKRITNAKKYWMQFERVELAKYRGLKKPSKFRIPGINTASLKDTIEATTNPGEPATQAIDRRR